MGNNRGIKYTDYRKVPGWLPVQKPRNSSLVFVGLHLSILIIIILTLSINCGYVKTIQTRDLSMYMAVYKVEIIDTLRNGTMVKIKYR